MDSSSQYSSIPAGVDYALATITVAVLVGNIAVSTDIGCHLWRRNKYKDSPPLELLMLFVTSWLYSVLFLPLVFVRFVTHQQSFEGYDYALIRILQGAFISCYMSMMVSKLLLHCLKTTSPITYSRYETGLRMVASVVHCLVGSTYLTTSVTLKCFTQEEFATACSYIHNDLWAILLFIILYVLAVLHDMLSDRHYLSFIYGGFILYDVLLFSYAATSFSSYVAMYLTYFFIPSIAIVINTASISGFYFLETNAVSTIVSVSSYLLYMALLVMMAAVESWHKILLVSCITIRLGISVLIQVSSYFGYL